MGLLPQWEQLYLQSEQQKAIFMVELFSPTLMTPNVLLSLPPDINQF